MLKSMTGYGNSELVLPGKKISIEIKSLNSKNIDTAIKVPHFYREKELDIRKILQERLERGKVDLSIFYELNENVASSTINKDIFRLYYNQLRELAGELQINESDLVPSILKLPDTIRSEKMELHPEEWEQLKAALNQAIDKLDNFRITEGKSIGEELARRTAIIEEYLTQIVDFEKERTIRIRERISRNLLEILSPEKIDQDRLEQEMIYYLEKLDISEEKSRLSQHCQYFKETLDEQGASGKKLAFITQEMGREINTLGSKASDSSIQHVVVKMKDELEKIKEQVLNIL